MSIKTLVAGFMLCVLSLPAVADTIALRADHPDRYTVQNGDTLWDISARFLDSPWRWPEVWSFNPQIDNPHLIYPGDIVVLSYDAEGRPILSVERSSPGAVKLAPQVRATRIDTPISTIPLDAIRQFIGLPRIITADELNGAGYMISSLDEHLIAGKGDEIYARGIKETPDNQFVVFRIGQLYRNEGAARDEILGYEALHVANAVASDYADPVTLHISHSNRESLVGDRLLPREPSELNQNFLPHPPGKPVDGQIIAVVDGVSHIGQYQTVVLNRGAAEGMEPGLVLAVYQKGRNIRDPRSEERGATVKLPNVRAGVVMVIKAYDKLSYALVMEAERDMKVYDLIGNP